MCFVVFCFCFWFWFFSSQALFFSVFFIYLFLYISFFFFFFIKHGRFVALPVYFPVTRIRIEKKKSKNVISLIRRDVIVSGDVSARCGRVLVQPFVSKNSNIFESLFISIHRYTHTNTRKQTDR